MLKSNFLAIQPHPSSDYPNSENLTPYQQGYKDALMNVLKWVERNEKRL